MQHLHKPQKSREDVAPACRNIILINVSELTGGGRGAGNQQSRRGEAKPLDQLRKLALRLVYAALRSFPPGRDWPRRRNRLLDVTHAPADKAN